MPTDHDHPAPVAAATEHGRTVHYRLSPGFPGPLREHCLRALVDLSRTVADSDDTLQGDRS